jgi:pyruvate/2-oxoacid:ferredoxin oxidoreductase alpha subunit
LELWAEFQEIQMRQLVKGNEAVVHAAIAAGCRAYFGYPITPASEIAETAALLLPKAGGIFLQAESEIAAIHMVYGCACAGVRAMSASSGPGISLMQEGISYLAGAELPCVIVDVVRGGPGLGNIGTEQSDYFAIVKGGGHGSYHNFVLAPNSVQEMCDLTIRAFEIADRYRNPVVVLADGALGQMMESVELPEGYEKLPEKPWAVTGDAAHRHNLITSLWIKPEVLEERNFAIDRKYREAEKQECMWQENFTEDADVLLVSYGITSRLALAAVEMARAQGIPLGLLRPISLYPFPAQRINELARKAKSVLVIELSNGQLIEDVRLAVNGLVPVHLFNRMGGMLPSAEDIMEEGKKLECERVGNKA